MQNWPAEQTLTLALLRGAQHPDSHSVSEVQIAAHVPPFVPTHSKFSQQSVFAVHAPLAPEQVFAQNPRGEHAITVLLVTTAQHPDSQSAAVVQAAAQYAWPVVVVGASHKPEQQAFGVLVHSAPAARQLPAPVSIDAPLSSDGTGFVFPASS